MSPLSVSILNLSIPRSRKSSALLSPAISFVAGLVLAGIAVLVVS